MRRTFERSFASAAALLLLAGSAQADQILQIHNDSLTTYLGSATNLQSAVPLVLDRGVGVDGAARRPAGYSWGFAGNPFGDAMAPLYKVGDVSLATGSYSPTDIDMALPAPGKCGVVIGRTYSGRQGVISHRSANGYQGFNWNQMSAPELQYYSDLSNSANDLVHIVYGADRYLEFQRTGSSSDYYQGRNGTAGVLVHVASGLNDPDWGLPIEYYVYYDQNGTQTYFFGTNGMFQYAGQFWKIVDAAGNSTYVGDPTAPGLAIINGYESLGKIQTLYDAAGRRYTYTYSGSQIGSAYRLTQVKAESKTGATWASPGTVTTVGQVDYDYYTSTVNDEGLAGDLKLVTVTTPLTDSGVSSIRKKNYWYYTRAWSNSAGRRGEAHEVKMVIGNEGYRKYDWLDSNVTNDTPLSATESDLQPYADAYLEYGDTGGTMPYKVSSAYFNGECGCSGGANGTYSILYESNGSYTDNSGYDTAWCKRAVVTQPDSNYCTYYFDEVGQPLSKAVTNADPAGSPTKTWVTGVDRDSNGCVAYIHTPANINTYTHNSGMPAAPDGTISYHSAAGLVNRYDRVSSGDMTGLPQANLYQEGYDVGSMPTSYYTSRTTYTQQDLNIDTGVNVTRPLVATSRVYPGATDYATPNASGTYNETSITYYWWSATNTAPLYITLAQITTTLPSVATGNNGSGSSNSTDRYLRPDGTTAFMRAADDVFDYTQYTNGQLTEQIRDVSTNGSFPSGEDPQSDFGIGDNATHSNRVTTYTYDAQGRPSTTTIPTGRVMENYYSRLKDQRSVRISWPRSVTSMGTTTRYGPAQYAVGTQAGKKEAAGVIAITSSGLTNALTAWIDETTADPIAAVTEGTLASLRAGVYSNAGHQLQEDRSYFLLPGSGTGTEGTNYDEVRYTYDAMGRRYRTKTAPGTITRTVFDEMGRAYQSWMGTNDHTFPDGESSGTDNMVKTSEMQFDGGSAGGNNYLTTLTKFVQGSTTGQRQTTYTNDFRGRTLLTVNPQVPYALNRYDNVGRLLASAQYTSTGSITVGTTDPSGSASGDKANRCALMTQTYDEMGRVCDSRRYEINQSTGAVDQVSMADQYLPTDTWFDPVGRVIKVKGESAFEKRRYDRLGRFVQRFALATDNDAANTYSDVYASGKTSVAGDVVLVEDQTAYESTDSDNVAMRVTIARLSTDLANGRVGELDTNSDGGSAGTGTLLTLTEADVKGRVQITSMWYDAIDRMTDSVSYGAAGVVGDATGHSHDFTRGGLSVPSRSDTTLRTTTAYNDDGTVLSRTDPRAIVTQYVYDPMFRQIKVIKNYDDGTPGPDDKDQTVVYGYTNGLRTSITADLPSPATDQVTTYIYGTTSGTPSQSKVATGHLLRAVKYPDTSNTGSVYTDIDSDASDVVSYAYNAQGQQVLAEDQAGNVIETTYDTGGRQISKAVTTLISGFDGAVRRVETSYLGRGSPDKVTQYDASSSGSVTDEMEYAYDDWGNVASFTQDVDSAIGGSGRADFAISYTYEKAAPSGGRSYLRRTQASYPGGSDLLYSYPNAGNLLCDAAGWANSITTNSVVVADYVFDGSGLVVETNLNEPAVSWQAASGSTYSDLDQFNRVTRSHWHAKTAGAEFYDVGLTYDRDSNIVAAVDAVRKDGSGNHVYDAKYTLDNLNRLTQTEEGAYSSGSISGRTREELWTLDQVGNMSEAKLDLNGDADFVDPGEMDDGRTYSVANQLSSRDIDSDTHVDYTPGYDANGNTTDDGKDYTYVWDPFGRLRFVKTRGGSPTVVAEYRYNGLDYRIGWHYDANSSGGAPDGSDPWYYFAYDDRWRMLNTFRGSDSDPKERFIYHNAGRAGMGGSSYIDSVVLRDRDNNSGWTSAADGTLEERRYYCQNWRSDVSAVVSDVGKLMESVKYSSYGIPTCFPAGDVNSDGQYNATDDGLIAGGYDVRKDTNLDGIVNAADISWAMAITGGYQTSGVGYSALSSPAIASRNGYAGHAIDSVLVSTLYVARFRVFSSTLGRWLRRDPALYLDGINLYTYRSSPIATLDPFGLCCQPVSVISEGPGLGDQPYTPPPVQCAWYSACIHNGGHVEQQDSAHFNRIPPNGCGPHSGLADWIQDNPFGFHFKQCCDNHDECLDNTCHTDGSGYDSCDTSFCNCLGNQCNSQGNYLLCFLLAQEYCAAVRAVNKNPGFCNRQAQVCRCIMPD